MLKLFYSLCTDEIPSASVVALGGHCNPPIYQKQLFGIVLLFFWVLVEIMMVPAGKSGLLDRSPLA